MIFPIAIGIPDELIVPCVPEKSFDFVFVRPGERSTYLFHSARDHDLLEYHTMLRGAWFATTRPKGGWDCLRHYEILAAGTLPYFIDIEAAPRSRLPFLPRDSLLHAKRLQGVYEGRIDPLQFSPRDYFHLVGEFLRYTRHRLAASRLAAYLLRTLGLGPPPLAPPKRVLFLLPLNTPFPKGGYVSKNLLTGLRTLLGAEAVLDFPRYGEVYVGGRRVHDRGGDMSTEGVQPLPREPPATLEAVRAQLAAGLFDAVVYSNARAPLAFWDLVHPRYAPERVAFLDGHDHLNASRILELAPQGRYFVREMEEGCPVDGYTWA